MTETLTLELVNDVYLKVHCEPSTRYELQEYFTFTVPGAKFMPAVRNRVWDGKIRLFNVATQLIYTGLALRICEFARERDYNVSIDNELYDSEFSLHEGEEFCKEVLSGNDIDARDYQVEAFTHAIRKRRALLLSPTASGKSLIIYLIARYAQEQTHKTLIVVPTTSLVYQMQSDIAKYGYREQVRVITGEENKSWRNSIDENIVVTTWQSIYKTPRPWFNQFGCVIGDEAHTFKSKSLISIMEKTDSCPYKFGFTGTLDGTQTNQLVLEGLFGPVKKVTTTSELIEKGTLADFNIKCLVLGYPSTMREQHKKDNYQDEVDFIVTYPPRNQFIVNLVKSLKGNTLVLFQYVEKHGKVLYNDLVSENISKDIYYVSGEVSASEREGIRNAVEGKNNAIIVASFGTFSTGTNIVNLHNVVFVSPSKSRIRVLQSIGRGLRKGGGKTQATLYDIADDLSWKSKRNFTLEHFGERVKFYNHEKFDYKIYQVKLAND